MTLQVDTRRLPYDVEANAVFGLETSTQIRTGLGGLEARYTKMRPRVTATCATGPATVAEIIDLYREQRGPRYAFTVLDVSDNTALNVVLTPDINGKYQLTKTYGTSRPEVRTIILPNLDSLAVKRDGVTQTRNTHYSITNGLITPITSPASWDDDVITWTSGDANTPGFFVPMRFADDNVDFSAIAKGVIKVQPFKLVEVFG